MDVDPDERPHIRESDVVSPIFLVLAAIIAYGIYCRVVDQPIPPPPRVNVAPAETEQAPNIPSVIRAREGYPSLSL